MHLLGTKIGGQLNMSGAKVSGTLNLDSATIGSSLFMREGKFDKAISCVLVQIGKNLDLRSAKKLSDIDLSGTHIKGELIIASPDTEPTWKDGAQLILRNTTAEVLQETRDAWPQHLDLDGFVYRWLGGLQGTTDVAARGSEWYVSWLAQDEPYTPLPYEQLATVLRRMGYVVEANDVLYASRERARALAYKVGHYWTWAGQSALKYTIGYGYGSRYFRSLCWVLVMVLIGTLFLHKSNQPLVPGQNGKPPIQICFFYSLDMLLPVIELRKQHYDVDLHGSVRYCCGQVKTDTLF